ncbi:MAG: phosphatase PAP2 family protein, partial [Spirochaetaceae bacterium]|nr:phosphatase PAP2 family protein [Spirochaetaceae bacterium]
MSLLLFLQKLREYVGGQWNELFLFITTLGEPLLSFLFLGFVYWCVNKRTGLLMAANVGVTCTYSHVFKYIFKVQRPWIKNSAIKPLEKALPNAGGYSFPSGHSARAGAIWGAFGIESYKSSKNLTLLLTGIIISLAVAFSRLFVGVHSVKDVLAGLLIAYAVCAAASFLLSWSEKGKNRDILISLLLLALCFVPMLKFGCISTAGFGIGVAVSWLLEKRFLQFEEAKNNTERAERFIFGSMGIILVQLWLNPFLKTFIPARYCGFFTQAAMAFYVLFAFPFVFTKIKKNWKSILLGLFAFMLSLSFFVSAAKRIYAKRTAISKPVYEKPILIGHRGYFANFPQNTMESFRGAVDIGVDMIELDVQMTSDGEIVIEHDNNLSRIGQAGSIKDYTYEQLLEMDFGGWFNEDFAGTRIAKLSELLEFMKQHPEITIYIELKDIGENAAFIQKVYSLVKDNGMMEQCYFASFQKDYLAEFKTIDSACKTIYILSKFDEST